MKKIILSSLVLAASSMMSAQQLVETYDYVTSSKHHPNAITTVPGNGSGAAGNRVDYFSESFDSGLAGDPGNGAWTTQIEPGGNPTVNWEVTNVGPANDAGSTFIIPTLQTSTPTNWMMIDSDSDGSSGLDENCSLISPVIDLSAAPANLKLEWDQFFAEWENDTLFVGISTDNGTTWTEWDVNQGVGRNGRPNPETVFINVSTEVAAAPSNVQIRFRWSAQWDYGWQLDNVRISDLPNNDLTITKVFHSNVSMDEPMYSKVPLSQITPLNIGAEIKNIGFDDQTNVGFDWEIQDGTGSVVASGSSTNNLANLAAGDLDSVWVSTGYTPATTDNYQIICTVTYDNIDDDPSNDENSFDYFEVTDFEFAVDYGIQESAFYNWANNNDGQASIGNVYTFNNAATIGAIWVGLDDNSDFVGDLLNVELYLFDQGTGDFNFMSQTQQIVQPGQEGQTIQIVLDNPVSAQSGDQYLAVAGHFGGTPGIGVQMAGKVAEGYVQGYDAQSQRVSLLDPSAPLVRLDLRDFTSIQESTLRNINIYPVPTSQVLNVDLTNLEGNVTFSLKDVSGKTVIEQTNNAGGISTIDIQNLSKGVYILDVNLNNNKTTKRVIVE